MNCQQAQERLEEYALGTLDPATREEVETHLGECADCRALATSYAESLAALPLALATASPHALPDQLRGKVIARILAEAPSVPAGEDDLAGNDSTPVLPPHPKAIPVNSWGFPMLRTRMALIAALVLLAIFLLWSIQLNSVLARERALRAEFFDLVGQQELVLEIVDSSHTVRRVLLPPLRDSRAYGKVFTRDDMPYVVAMAARLTPPPTGQAYHLWLTRDDVTFLAGTLRTNSDGFGLVIYEDRMTGPQYTRAIVTLQPLDSTTPVEPPILEWLPEE